MLFSVTGLQVTGWCEIVNSSNTVNSHQQNIFFFQKMGKLIKERKVAKTNVGNCKVTTTVIKKRSKLLA